MLKFLYEHKSWLMFVIFFNIILNVLLLLDEGLASVSIVYINVLFYSLLFLFCTMRFWKDKAILKQLEEIELTPLKAQIASYYKEQLIDAHNQHQILKWQTAEAHDQLLAWVHDMKSPLTAMKLMIDGMEQSDTKRKLAAEWLRLNLYVDQQLHLTRLQTIEQDSRFEKVLLKDIVVSEIKGLQSWCIEKGIGVELMHVQSSIKTDAKWLAFIIRQYLTNAIKYSERDQEIIIRESVSAEGHVILSVENRGIEIAPHDLPRIFNKSYTGTKGRESASASGMGLYLAKQAADSIGVKLIIESSENRTCAIIQFPLENEYTNQLGM